MKDLDLEYPKCLDELLSHENSFAKYTHVISNEVYNNQKSDFHPLISIIVPTYNADFVTGAIKSAVNQKNAPLYEIVVVDNHSDDTIFTEMMKYVKSLNLNIIRVYQNQDNLGMYGNWNRGIELAKADYVTFLHSDDLLTDTCIKDLWDCHNQIEPDAAIITYERITTMNGDLVREDSLPKTRLFGLLKPKLIAKRIKLQLLSPHGNGCGHFFSKSVLKELGGYNACGDQGLVLNYNLNHPVYDYKHITRIKRVGKNESVRVAESFRNYGYYLRNIVIKQFFGDNVFLRYISKLEVINTAFSEYGVKPLRQLNKQERLVLTTYHKYVNFVSGYTFL